LLTKELPKAMRTIAVCFINSTNCTSTNDASQLVLIVLLILVCCDVASRQPGRRYLPKHATQKHDRGPQTNQV
jgi:hypothetical protein